jgi:glycosyltransferase involved in cell wall biosynthesis
MTEPLISVVMPVYNAEKYLEEAIESILSQSYENFEFIILNDGSTDRSLEIIKKFSKRDPRIKVISRNNKGLSATLNEGINLARGKYFARQDADDISNIDRFKKQVRFMDENPSISLLGTNYRIVDEKGNHLNMTDVFTHPKDLKMAVIFSNQFGHGSIMLRKEILKQTGSYENCLAEDYDLWTKVSRVGQIANLEEPLYSWRLTNSGLWSSPEKAEKIRMDSYRIRDREFNYYLKHKNQFWVMHIGLGSTRGGAKKYFEMKNRMFRDMALLYCYRGLRRRAVPILLLALFFAPWVKKTYLQLRITLFHRNMINQIEYEYI